MLGRVPLQFGAIKITVSCTSHTCLVHGTYLVQVSLIFLFRLILIAEKDKVYDKFPIPLINRLEKHLVTTSTILRPDQQEVLLRLDQWIDGFTEVQGYILSCTKAFYNILYEKHYT